MDPYEVYNTVLEEELSWEATGRTFYLAEKQLPKDGLIHVG